MGDTLRYALSVSPIDVNIVDLEEAINSTCPNQLLQQSSVKNGDIMSMVTVMQD